MQERIETDTKEDIVFADKTGRGMTGFIGPQCHETDGMTHAVDTERSDRTICQGATCNEDPVAHQELLAAGQDLVARGRHGSQGRHGSGWPPCITSLLVIS